MDNREIKEQDLVLQDVELCKKVEPIMERLGIDPDGYFTDEGYVTLVECSEVQWMLPGEPSFGAYRQDKLALALPDWCFEFGRLMQTISFKYDLPKEIDPATFDDYMYKFVKERGQKQLEATAKLLILLEEKELLNEKNKG